MMIMPRLLFQTGRSVSAYAGSAAVQPGLHDDAGAENVAALDVLPSEPDAYGDQLAVEPPSTVLLSQSESDITRSRSDRYCSACCERNV